MSGLRRWQFYHYAVRFMASAPKNHYEALGVSSNSTQAEIKTAYYELSKQYHPDTSATDEDTLVRFRQITAAYEILGNVQSRKMYDRGLVVGAYGTTLRREATDEDDPTARFYKKREKRSSVPTAPGGQTVYNFDAWTKAHYDVVRDRRYVNRMKIERDRRLDLETRSHSKLAVLALCFSVVLYMAAASTINSEDDFVKQPRVDNR